MKKQQFPSSRKCCEDVKEALIDLFINVKIRNDQSMYDITTEQLDDEKALMRRQDSLELIECIKKSIELLISLKMDED
jgi:hypothetical protein